ncbi:MAG: hypothetical protein ACRELC_09540 [Gemmatimonadota bacterium]
MLDRFGRASLVLVLGLLPLQPTCEGDSTSGGQRLRGSAGSLHELSARVLAGLASADTARLRELRLTEGEHNDLVWPELPAGAPESGFPVDVAWTNISLRDARALARLLPLYAGHELALVEAECRGRTHAFESFRVHTDCRVTLERDGVRLAPQQLFKDVLVWDGEHKIFRYYEP